MPAKNQFRTSLENSYIHIYNRGIEDRVIFNDASDYQVFLSFLQEYLSAPGNPDTVKKSFQVNGRTFLGIPHLPKNYFNAVELVAYNLMPDHLHLVIRQVNNGSSEKFIRSLLTRYVIYFNKKYNRTGSLFAGPYKSAEIEAGRQICYLSRYLHSENGYSSYQEYLGKRISPWVKPSIVLDNFNGDRASYKNFVEQKNDPDDNLLNEKLILEKQRIAPEMSIPNPTHPKTTHHHKVPTFPLFFPISLIFFALLLGLGERNISVRNIKANQLSEAPSANVLSETTVVKQEPSPTPTITKTPPKTSIVVKADTEESYVNIREKPTTNSKIISKAKDKEVFEVISKNSGWFEIKTASDSAGFISILYVEELK